MTTDEAAPPILGVLGGMGPAATADFLARLARLTPARRDQDHIPTIVYSDPQTPDRSDAILGRGPSPLPAMLRGIDFLNQAGCALIAIPCNTAHYWYEELAARSRVPILHIADATIERLRGRPAHRVGVLATDGTIQAGIYHRRLRAAGLEPLDLLQDAGDNPSAGDNPVMRGIRLMKGGDPAGARESLEAGAKELVNRGADALVAGCTDVSAALAGASMLAGVPLLDAATCLVEASIARLAPMLSPHP
jgi:aspartate racemase